MSWRRIKYLFLKKHSVSKIKLWRHEENKFHWIRGCHATIEIDCEIIDPRTKHSLERSRNIRRLFLGNDSKRSKDGRIPLHSGTEEFLLPLGWPYNRRIEPKFLNRKTPSCFEQSDITICNKPLVNLPLTCITCTSRWQYTYCHISHEMETPETPAEVTREAQSARGI